MHFEPSSSMEDTAKTNRCYLRLEFIRKTSIQLVLLLINSNRDIYKNQTISDQIQCSSVHFVYVCVCVLEMFTCFANFS